jgi:hypothetical protein
MLTALIASPDHWRALAGGPHFERFRHMVAAQDFLAGASPAAIGAIAGAAVTVGLT